MPNAGFGDMVDATEDTLCSEEGERIMRVVLFVIALVGGMLAFVPASASADIGPCNNCQSSIQPSNGGDYQVLGS